MRIVQRLPAGKRGRGREGGREEGGKKGEDLLSGIKHKEGGRGREEGVTFRGLYV